LCVFSSAPLGSSGREAHFSPQSALPPPLQFLYLENRFSGPFPQIHLLFSSRSLLIFSACVSLFAANTLRSVFEPSSPPAVRRNKYIQPSHYNRKSRMLQAFFRRPSLPPHTDPSQKKKALCRLQICRQRVPCLLFLF